MQSGEAHILKGFEAIVNQDNVRPGVDLKALERQMISGGMVVAAKERDPSEKLNDALSQAAKKLGINFDDVAGKRVQVPTQNVRASPIRPSPARSSPMRTPSNNDGGNNGGGNSGYIGSSGYNNGGNNNSGGNNGNSGYNNSGNNNSGNSGYNNGGGGGSTSGYNNGGGSGDGFLDAAEHEENSDSDDSDHGDYRIETTPQDVFARTPATAGGSLLVRTLEQERRSHIDSVVGTSINNDFSLEKEKREDLKCSMLAEIDSLLTSLSMEEVNLDRIPKVDMKSTFEEVETTLKILRHKNDQTRCCTFAEEGLMFAAYALEDLFDGKQVWFGRWSPDLTGYHNQMNVKLRRVRYDTGQIVGAIMEDYNIGPGIRIGLEIIPNMFLYSKMRKQQHSQPGLGVDDAAEVERASANLRNL
jgi:hypothetical protein